MCGASANPSIGQVIILGTIVWITTPIWYVPAKIYEKLQKNKAVKKNTKE